jgi:hypothetical protein
MRSASKDIDLTAPGRLYICLPLSFSSIFRFLNKAALYIQLHRNKGPGRKIDAFMQYKAEELGIVHYTLRTI